VSRTGDSARVKTVNDLVTNNGNISMPSESKVRRL
jgi:hypothetical protein